MILDFSFLDLLILHSKIFTIYASKYLCMNNCMNISIWSITNIMIYKPILKSIRPKLSINISKPHFAQVSVTKKPTSPTFFDEFVWNF